MRSSLLRFVTRVALVAAAALLITDAPVQADAPTAHGYWWRWQTTVGVPVPPPGVPEGGLWVRREPSGDQAVSAVRYVPPEGRRARTLNLRIASSTGAVALVACPARAAWAPVEAGSWEARPEADCTTATVDGVVDTEAGVVTFDLASLPGDVVDLVLEPAQGDRLALFDVTFEKPDDGAVELVPESDGETTTTTTITTITTTTAPPSDAGAETGWSPPVDAAASRFTPPTTTTTAPAQAASEPPDNGNVALPAGHDELPGRRRPWALLALAIAVAGWLYGLKTSAPRAAAHPLVGHVAALARAAREGRS